MKRSHLATLLLALVSCATRQADPPSATPQQLHANVAAFAQPTQDGRLATLKAQLDAASLAYTVEAFEGRRKPDPTGYNVVVRVGPAAGKEILLTAHYDAVVLGDGKLVDGAVDNAGSVVTMIEATRRIAGRTKHPVRLILLDQEELGLVGAQAWIEAHGVENVAAVINADVNGNGDTLMYGLNNGQQSLFMIGAVKEVCAERAISCLDFPEYPPSDDRAFSAAGAPTISLGQQPKAEAEKLRHFLIDSRGYDPAAAPPAVLTLIHTPNDTIAAIDSAALALTADTFTALVLKLDATLAN